MPTVIERGAKSQSNWRSERIRGRARYGPGIDGRPCAMRLGRPDFPEPRDFSGRVAGTNRFQTCGSIFRRQVFPDSFSKPVTRALARRGVQLPMVRTVLMPPGRAPTSTDSDLGPGKALTHELLGDRSPSPAEGRQVPQSRFEMSPVRVDRPDNRLVLQHELPQDLSSWQGDRGAGSAEIPVSRRHPFGASRVVRSKSRVAEPVASSTRSNRCSPSTDRPATRRRDGHRSRTRGCLPRSCPPLGRWR